MELPLHHEEFRKGLKFCTGRNCLEYILRVRAYKKIYIPYFTCEVVLQPIEHLGLAYEFYSVDWNMEPIYLPNLEADEVFLYTNYYGLKDRYVAYLTNRYGNQLIVDNALAFYSTQKGGDQFFTAYKFFGVSDGAYLEMNEANPFIPLQEDFPQDTSFQRMKHLLWRIDTCAEDGFMEFKRSKESMAEMPISKMSRVTERILGTLDYEEIRRIRNVNFRILDELVGTQNLLQPLTKNLSNDCAPMAYPFYVENADEVRRRLFANRIYPAQYWPNVLEWCQPDSVEYQLANNILALPIDQRYGEEEMKRIIEIICKSQK